MKEFFANPTIQMKFAEKDDFNPLPYFRGYLVFQWEKRALEDCKKILMEDIVHPTLLKKPVKYALISRKTLKPIPPHELFDELDPRYDQKPDWFGMYWIGPKNRPWRYRLRLGWMEANVVFINDEKTQKFESIQKRQKWKWAD